MTTTTAESLTHDQFMQTTEAMSRFGGSWMQNAAKLLRISDPIRRQRLLDTFPEILDNYGPGSIFYKDAAPESDVASSRLYF